MHTKRKQACPSVICDIACIMMEKTTKIFHVCKTTTSSTPSNNKSQTF